MRAEPLQTQHGISLHPLAESAATRDFALNEWDLLLMRAGVPLSLCTLSMALHNLTVDLQRGVGQVVICCPIRTR